MPQPDISRDEGYWQQGGWPELLSRCTPEILTPELVRRIVTLCATHPHWKREEVYQHLQDLFCGIIPFVPQAQVGWNTFDRGDRNSCTHTRIAT